MSRIINLVKNGRDIKDRAIQSTAGIKPKSKQHNQTSKMVRWSDELLQLVCMYYHTYYKLERQSDRKYSFSTALEEAGVTGMFEQQMYLMGATELHLAQRKLNPLIQQIKGYDRYVDGGSGDGWYDGEQARTSPKGRILYAMDPNRYNTDYFTKKGTTAEAHKEQMRRKRLSK